MEKCDFCGGQLRYKTLKHYDYSWGNRVFRFECVPAHVCEACGEEYFDAVVSQAMNKAVMSEEKPKRFDRIPVFDLKTPIPA